MTPMGMSSAAREKFLDDITPKLEGYTPFMYLDVKGYVTTGIGNLIENLATNEPGGVVSPFAMAWKRNSDGMPASRAEIEAEWRNIKSLQQYRQQGGFYYKQFTTLHLDSAGMRSVIEKSVTTFVNELERRYPDFSSWPDNAQVATMLVAWAYGPAFGAAQGLGTLASALIRGDFGTAASVFPKPALTKERNDIVKTLYEQSKSVGKEPSSAEELPVPPQEQSDTESGISSTEREVDIAALNLACYIAIHGTRGSYEFKSEVMKYQRCYGKLVLDGNYGPKTTAALVAQLRHIAKGL